MKICIDCRCVEYCLGEEMCFANIIKDRIEDYEEDEEEDELNVPELNEEAEIPDVPVSMEIFKAAIKG